MSTVTTSALIKRINRRLAQENEQLHSNGHSRSWTDLGDYYVTDRLRNTVTASHVDLEQFGRDLGVLQQHETTESLTYRPLEGRQV